MTFKETHVATIVGALLWYDIQYTMMHPKKIYSSVSDLKGNDHQNFIIGLTIHVVVSFKE